MMSPPTLPQPNPSVETVRPVLPRLRDCMGVPPCASPALFADAFAVVKSGSASRSRGSSGTVGADAGRARREVSMAPSYVPENNEQRARLRALVERLSDSDLARPLDA